MRASISQFVDRLRGNGRYAVTTPPMDGVLQPNNLIEEAPLLAEIEKPDNLVTAAGEIYFSSATKLLKLNGSKSEIVTTFHREINAVAASAGTALAIALSDGEIIIRGGAHDGLSIDRPEAESPACVTALCFQGEDTLIVCHGSDRNPLSEWKRDLMERNATGSVWRLDLASKAYSEIVGELAFPFGVMTGADGTLIVSESWRSRLIAVDPAGRIKPVVEDLPGYPSRLARHHAGPGAWLSVFAPRSQMIEFVLREDKFRRDMLRTIPSDLWMAPSLKAPRSYLEPLQGGGLKQLGVMKPWAPTRSFGLVISFNEKLEPMASWHSRADGTRHGITSIADHGRSLIVASKGGDALVALEHNGGLPS